MFGAEYGCVMEPMKWLWVCPPKAMHSAMNGRQHTLLENSLVELGDGWWVLSNGNGMKADCCGMP